MTEIILMLLLAIVVIFVIARLLKDAKAFTRLMAILAVSVIVGAGLKQSIEKYFNQPEKATVVSTEAAPIQSSITPFVLENTDACLDSEGKDIAARDSVETQLEETPTVLNEVGYIDDS